MILLLFINCFLLTMMGCSHMQVNPIATPPSKVMTLNFCQKMEEPRLKRFERVAQYLVDYNVDVLLFQEGSGGLMDETFNSPKDLYWMTRDRGTPFQYVSANNLGALGFLTFKVGVSTRHPIDWTYTGLTCKPEGDWFDTLPLPFRRNVVAIGIGDIAFISTHFYSGADKMRQATKLIQIINNITYTYGPTHLVIGGDFNMGRNDPAYKLMVDAGYVEAAGADIDFIFTKNLVVKGGISFFQAGEVSDHPAVVATIE